MSGRLFTSAERELLRHVLNRLVPESPGLPAAGDLGIAAYLEEVVGARAGMGRLLLDGLRRIARIGEGRHPDGYAALTGDEQDSVLGVVEREDPGFFEVLVAETYSGYYSHPTVLRHLGVEGPPQPRGHTLEPFQGPLVERVRRSGFTYRQV